MSTLDDRENVATALHLGAADYLVKPLRSSELTNLWTHVWCARATAPLPPWLRSRGLLGLTDSLASAVPCGSARRQHVCDRVNPQRPLSGPPPCILHVTNQPLSRSVTDPPPGEGGTGRLCQPWRRRRSSRLPMTRASSSRRRSGRRRQKRTRTRTTRAAGGACLLPAPPSHTHTSRGNARQKTPPRPSPCSARNSRLPAWAACRRG